MNFCDQGRRRLDSPSSLSEKESWLAVPTDAEGPESLQKNKERCRFLVAWLLGMTKEWGFSNKIFRRSKAQRTCRAPCGDVWIQQNMATNTGNPACRVRLRVLRWPLEVPKWAKATLGRR